MIGSRRTLPELMDDPSVADDQVDRALNELSFINRWLGGFRVSRLGVGSLINSLPMDRPVSVLDVGAGGSDLPKALGPLGRQVDVTSLDLNFHACVRAGERRPPVRAVNGSAFSLPFRDRSFDIVHVSLFLHHCTDAEARTLLADLTRVARLGIVINDLHRHALAYVGISMLTGVFSHSALVRNDAPVSVLRGFLRDEIEALLPDGVKTSTSISWRWAFRWCICIPLTPRKHHASRI
jgi:ubiquinone/menaquinone biosynthesis C-methylase UbiE